MRVEWRTLRIWIGALSAVIAALAALYLGYANAHPSFVKPPKHADHRTLALWVLAGVAITNGLAKPLRLLTIGRFAGRRERVKTAMRALPWTAYDTCHEKVPVRQIGASAWWIVGFWKFKFLYRLSRERFSPTPQASNIRWKKGKGVIGRCWDKEREQIVQTELIDGEWSTKSEAEWNAWTGKPEDDTRMRLKFPEFQRITGKYGTVIAVEIKDRNQQVVGVVALDSPPGHHADLCLPEVVADVTRASALVAQLMGRA